MKFLCRIFLVFFTCTLSYGQVVTRDEGRLFIGSNFNFYENIKISNTLFSTDDKKIIRYADIDGSPYIDNHSAFGKIYDANFNFLGTAYVRYNAYTDDIEIAIDTNGVDYYLVKKKPNFLYFELNGQTYRAFEYFDGSIKTVGYFSILNGKDQDKCTILKKEKVIFKDEKKPENSFLTATPPKFIRQKDKFFIKIENQILEIPKRNKDLLNLFTEKRKEVEAYIISNKIKTDDENGLIELLTYYNSLFK